MSETSERMKPPVTSQERKDTPVFDGCFRYFPAALMLVSRLSKAGNDKHNPGQPMHHARGKSTDHGNCILRHQIDVGTIDPEMQLDHAVEVAWRALAQLQEIAEKQYGWPLAPGAKLAEPKTRSHLILKEQQEYRSECGQKLVLLKLWDSRRDTPRFPDCDCTVSWLEGELKHYTTGYDTRKLQHV